MSEDAGPCIAVVGTGPRALWALESLAALARDADARRPASVHVVGPDDLGPGLVYATDQPEHLRLNVASAVVDVWRGDDTRGPCLDAWRGLDQQPAGEAAFPSRALTGRYLREQAGAVVAELQGLTGPGGVEHVRNRVERVARRDDGWYLDALGPFDEVLLSTGHSWDWHGALRHHWDDTLPPLHDSVFPVDRLLARAEVRAGSTIVVRGAALTAVDVVVALSLGRGLDPADLDLDVALVSRTGRLMLPKTRPDVLADVIAGAGDLTRHEVAAATPGEDVLAVLTDVAVALLGGGPAARSNVDDAVAGLETGASAQDPLEELRRQVAVARGEQPPDGTWALAQAWRLLYRHLVARQDGLGGTGGPTLGWPQVRRWARELERLAFGPPLVNAELLLTALESGRVTVRAGDAGEVAREVSADLVVDAVLAPPGIVDLPAEDVLARLHRDAVLSVVPDGRGARVAPDATVVDAGGHRVPGLAIVGRATEDAVLGNDTLVRPLHPAVDHWARRVLGLPTVGKDGSS